MAKTIDRGEYTAGPGGGLPSIRPAYGTDFGSIDLSEASKLLEGMALNLGAERQEAVDHAAQIDARNKSIETLPGLIKDSLAEDLDPTEVQNRLQEFNSSVLENLSPDISNDGRRAVEGTLSGMYLQYAGSYHAQHHNQQIQKIENTFQKTARMLGNDLLDAPTLENFQAAVAQINVDAEFMQGLPPAQREAMVDKALNSLTYSFAGGVLQQNPLRANRLLKSGALDAYLDPNQKASLMNQAQAAVKRSVGTVSALNKALSGKDLTAKEVDKAFEEWAQSTLPSVKDGKMSVGDFVAKQTQLITNVFGGKLPTALKRKMDNFGQLEEGDKAFVGALTHSLLSSGNRDAVKHIPTQVVTYAITQSAYGTERAEKDFASIQQQGVSGQFTKEVTLKDGLKIARGVLPADASPFEIDAAAAMATNALMGPAHGDPALAENLVRTMLEGVPKAEIGGREVRVYGNPLPPNATYNDVELYMSALVEQATGEKVNTSKYTVSFPPNSQMINRNLGQIMVINEDGTLSSWVNPKTGQVQLFSTKEMMEHPAMKQTVVERLRREVDVERTSLERDIWDAVNKSIEARMKEGEKGAAVPYIKDPEKYALDWLKADIESGVKGGFGRIDLGKIDWENAKTVKDVVRQVENDPEADKVHDFDLEFDHWTPSLGGLF